MPVAAVDRQDGDVFGDGFAGHEGGCDGGAGLHDVEVHFGVVAWFDQAFVLVAPKYEIHKLW